MRIRWQVAISFIEFKAAEMEPGSFLSPYPTSPKPTSAVRDPGMEHFERICSSSDCRST
jgi:hypothetical protein